MNQNHEAVASHEFTIEPAVLTAPKARPPLEAKVKASTAHFRVADDEFDLIQTSAENDFFQQMCEGDQHRYGRSARASWE